jgi:methylenetetrahydrofolate reductase (NADPH)
MTVLEHIKQAKETLVSFEILPPLKGKGIQAIFDHLDPLMEFKPAYINVTYHRSEHIFKKRADGSFEKVVIRKRPGTEAICASIMNRYNVDTVPHLICGGFSVQETEDALLTLNYLGINNVLVLRGDAPHNLTYFEPEPDGHKYAIDLLKQVISMNKGLYLEEELKGALMTNFSVGVAGYPEKHFEAPNLQTDLMYLKAKVEAGADYIVTQMFFDNKVFFEFEKKCRAIGITVPIIPGLKPVTSKKQLVSIPKSFYVDIPDELSGDMMRCNNEKDMEKVGAEWLLNQAKELKAAGVPVLHFYTLGKPQVIADVMKKI